MIDCPVCGKNSYNMIEYDMRAHIYECRNCGYTDTYESAKEANAKLADFVDKVENRIAGEF